jgi:hypothetical protein
MEKRLGTYGVFLSFAIMAALNFVYILAVVPETRGYTLEQITTIWSNREKSWQRTYTRARL